MLLMMLRNFVGETLSDIALVRHGRHVIDGEAGAGLPAVGLHDALEAGVGHASTGGQSPANHHAGAGAVTAVHDAVTVVVLLAAGRETDAESGEQCDCGALRQSEALHRAFS